jgi:hypothetical protein
LKPEVEAIEANLPPLPGDVQRSSDQSRPLLTWVGEKLRPAWMSDFIAGKIANRPRPWLASRMPAFSARAAGIANGLSLEHGFPLAIPDEPAPDPAMQQIGKKLSGRVGGFSCNTCHAIGPAPALTPFDSPAPNFAITTARLRKPFFHRWVRSPQKYNPGTRMPTFADAEGKTTYKDVLDGDSNKQFEAIWQYLREADKIEPPE